MAKYYRELDDVHRSAINLCEESYKGKRKLKRTQGSKLGNAPLNKTDLPVCLLFSGVERILCREPVRNVTRILPKSKA